jgi:hypothetical protein
MDFLAAGKGLALIRRHMRCCHRISPPLSNLLFIIAKMAAGLARLKEHNG